MERAYVRRTIDEARTWVPIGWYCMKCGLVWAVPSAA
jgi:hypothetical protein